MPQNRVLSEAARAGRADPDYAPVRCGHCGTEFRPYRVRNVRWCSTACKKRAESAGPRSRPKACAHCGTSFLPAKSARQRFCQPECKRAAYEAAVRADPVRRERRRAAKAAYSRTPTYRASQRRAKELRRAAEREGTLTRAEWQAILDRYHHRCAYCRADGPLTMDHVTPLSRGGRHEAENVVPACGPCNLSKGDRDWTERLLCP